MNSDLDKVILTDCDGVLMNWELAFNDWMAEHGYQRRDDAGNTYNMAEMYGISNDEKRRLVREFNESAAIGNVPPLRDAMYYVDLLHRKHGYVFHMITSLSLDKAAQDLRIENTKKLFGDTAFAKFIFCDTGADKDDALEPYKDSGLYWVEDKPENADLGTKMGLESLLVEHGHNKDNSDHTMVKNWKDIYYHVTGE